MNMLKVLLIAVLAGGISLPAQAEIQTKGQMEALIKNNFAFADSQYRYMMTLRPLNKMPQTYLEKTDKFVAYDIKWWCSGFYPGSLWYIYEQTKNEEIKKEAERTLKVLEPNQTFTGNHDLGFMMYCSFGNAYRITGNQEYKKILFNSAEALATRYRPSIKSIQSWDSSANFRCPVIIDNMMNLEMLEWVSQQGGSERFSQIARNHSNSTIKNHYRPDYSSWHVLEYDLQTGKVVKKLTWQGAADCSSWSRGQAWGLYGFTMMYRFTKNKQYLKMAENIARYTIRHPNMPDDKVPYWDYYAPFKPRSPRDASAAALNASALLELAQYTKGAARQEYLKHAEQVILTLSSPQYLAKYGTNGGFLLKHSTGAHPQGSEIDVPLVYADYYYLEALKRYKDWYL